MPKPRVLPCAICHQLSPSGDQQLLSCRECRLSVHRKCYGVMDNRQPGKWTCDMCQNDKNPQVSLVGPSPASPVDVLRVLTTFAAGVQVCTMSH
jgi:hypothetical protein